VIDLALQAKPIAVSPPPRAPAPYIGPTATAHGTEIRLGIDAELSGGQRNGPLNGPYPDRHLSIDIDR